MVNNNNEFKLEIPIDIYAKVMGWVLACDIEVSGMGQLKRTADGYIVTSAFILDQTCTSVETEMSAEALGVLEYECEDGKHKDDGDLIWWWHSHVDMPVFWSDTDHAAIKQMSPDNGRIVATVFNKHREFRTAYRQGNSNYTPSVFVDDIETTLTATETALKSIKNRVLQPKFIQPDRPKMFDVRDHLTDKMFKSGRTVTKKAAVKMCKKMGYQAIDAEEYVDDYKEDMGAYPISDSDLQLYINDTYIQGDFNDKL